MFKHFLPKIVLFKINVEKYGTARDATDGNITRRMRFKCWIPKATNTNSEYVILIVFPRQKLFRERALMLRLTYIVRLVECLKAY